MPDIRIDQKTLQAAIKALQITVPIYVAIQDENGDILITTRNGTQAWKPCDSPQKPPAKRKKPPVKRSKRAATTPRKGATVRRATHKRSTTTPGG